MPLIALTCPNCQANIDLDDSREFGFCSYCGTKLIMQDVRSNVRIDESEKLHNLIEIAKTTLPHESIENIQNMATRILELDSSGWYGWFLKGVAESKSFNHQAMYNYWKKAISLVNPDDLKILSDDIIDYTSRALINEEPLENTEAPLDFIRAFDLMNCGYFMIRVIRHFIDDVNYLSPFRAGYLMKYLSVFVSVELHKSGDIRPFLGCTRELMILNDRIPNIVGREYTDIKHYINCHIYPYQCICKEHADIFLTDLSHQIEYWENHDISEYADCFDKSIILSRGLYDTDSISQIDMKWGINNNVSRMLKNYLAMGEKTPMGSRTSLFDRIDQAMMKLK